MWGQVDGQVSLHESLADVLPASYIRMHHTHMMSAKFSDQYPLLSMSHRVMLVQKKPVLLLGITQSSFPVSSDILCGWAFLFVRRQHSCQTGWSISNRKSDITENPFHRNRYKYQVDETEI